jgi:hypothetical protein
MLIVGGIYWLTTAKPRSRTIQLTGAATRPIPQYQIEITFVTSPNLDADMSRTGEQWLPAERGAQRWPRWLQEDEHARLVDIARRDANGSVVTGPRLMLENGTSSVVTVSRNTRYIADLKVIVQNGKPTTQPILHSAESGLSIKCLARPGPDRDSITLDLEPQTTALLDITTRPWKAPKGTDMPDQIVQVPITLQARLNIRLTMPLGVTALYRVTPIRTPPATQPGLVERPVFMMIRPRPATTSATQQSHAVR